MYYAGAGVEALKKWKKMSKEERDATKKGDDIDDISTSDLEKPDEVDDDTINEISFDYLERNRINLARMFYGYDGGYTVRKLKKFLKNERLAMAQEKEDSKKDYNRRQAARRGEDEDESEAAADAAEPATGKAD
jgi:mRNA-degrading endonuclease RelE of RelBE toxin-antitoxin system